MELLWLVSSVDTETCSEKLHFYRCRDEDIDDEYVDHYYGRYTAWKIEGNKISASEDGLETDRYYLYNLASNKNSLTSKFISDEKTNTDTYYLLSEEDAYYIKEEWVEYLKDYETNEEYNVANATFEFSSY